MPVVAPAFASRGQAQPSASDTGGSASAPSARPRMPAALSGLVLARLRRSRAQRALVSAHAEFLSRARAEVAAGSTAVDALAYAADAVGMSVPDPRFGNPFALIPETAGAAASTRLPHAVSRAWNLCRCAWDVHHEHGVALAPLLGVAERILRDEQELQSLLDNELASVRASSRMLMVLPAVTPLLGLTMGCDPWGWLAGNPAGWAVAFAGAVLFAASAFKG